MSYPVKFPDGREFGPYSLDELRQYSGEGKFPPNTEIFSGGEWVSLGGWLVVRKRVEELAAAEASKPKAAPPPSATHNSLPGSAQDTARSGAFTSTNGPVSPARAIAIGAVLFALVVAAALYLR